MRAPCENPGLALSITGGPVFRPTAPSPLTANGFREDAAEDDPMHVMVRRGGPAGFPQLFILDPDRDIIEINGAP
jgi:hypothetical protein